jgi:eukaryotic-like serine/threonine-protein kinase
MVPDPDETAFEVLDAYLSRMHAGERPNKQAVLDAHPELAGVLECLEALDILVPLPANAATLPPSDVNPDASLIGEKTLGDLGKYEILCELGRGGMGVVYKARQKDLGRLVALKMILASQLASADVIDRFHDEARAAAAVQHPNITALYDAGQLLGQPFIAIQFIDGPSLAQRLAQGPIPPESAARIVAAVARAVHHLHFKGVIHRDLKPSNVLLDGQGQPYVTDFGLVKMLAGDSHKTTTGAILGTPSYMAPEQAAGRTLEIGPLTDIYSIGAVLYECLTGRPPFREATPLDTLMQVLESDPVRPREINAAIPRPLEAICLRCLERSPQRRYPTAEAVADNLEKYLKGEEVEGLAAGLVPRLGRWLRREPALVSRLAAFAVCFTLIQVNYFVAGNIELWPHLIVTALLLAWSGVSYLCQKLLNTGRWDEDVPFAWAASDMLVWTVVLIVSGRAPHGPLVVGYACLIAAAGLWFRVRLVWFVTALSLLSYVVVIAVYLMTGGEIDEPHHQMIFAVALIVLGGVVSYQVNRVRALSRYYERRTL